LRDPAMNRGAIPIHPPPDSNTIPHPQSSPLPPGASLAHKGRVVAETGTTRRLCWWLMLAGAVGAGCHSGPAQIASLKPDEEAYYQSVATRLDFPAPASSPADEPAAVFTQAPRRLRDLRK